MMAPKAPYLASAAILYNSRGRSPQPACKAKPITGRTLGAQGQRPGGAINPHARKGVSTFGNTGKHRPGPGPDPDRAERRLNPQAPKGLVHMAPATKGGCISDARREVVKVLL